MHPRSIHFLSLGCPKNRVDSEVMLGTAGQSGFSHVDDPAEADVIVVNTCGFIEEAKKESIDAIFEMARYKSEGRCERLVVAGCLAQRHARELADEIPEIDHLLGSSDMLKLRDVLAGSAERVLVGSPAEWLIAASSPRTLSTPVGSAYVKIAEGCNRTCSFCVIPQLRGKQRSRPIADVVREVEQLVDQGVKEINLVSQDTIAYGRDQASRPKLAELVQAVAEVQGAAWVRLFYLYPEAIDAPLIDLLANHPRVLPYVDMPLQHAADAMLKRMRRGHGGARLRRVVDSLRERVPGLTFRTAFIVGHPGETDEEFEELCEFVCWAKFDRMGVFTYSDEETAKSHALGDKVAPRIARNRRKKLLGMQRRISKELNEALIGKELDVLVEGPSEEHPLVMAGRHAGQAPDIDGQVFLSGAEVDRGSFVRVRITQAADYDLVGEVLSGGSVGAAAARPTAVRTRGGTRRLPIARTGTPTPLAK